MLAGKAPSRRGDQEGVRRRNEGEAKARGVLYHHLWNAAPSVMTSFACSQLDDADMNVDRQGMRRVRAVRRRSMVVTTLRWLSEGAKRSNLLSWTIDELQMMLRRRTMSRFDAAS